MIIITKNTEKILLRDFEKIFKSEKIRDCFYIHLSQADIDREIWLPVFIHAMQKIKNVDQAHVYICHDQDLFILMPDLSDKAFSKLLAEMEKELETTKLTNLAGKFDLNQHWESFEILCQKKVRAYCKALEEKNKKKKEDFKYPVELDADLIASIKKRRRKAPIPHVMVVDDDQISCTLVQRALGVENTVSVSHDGKSAIEDYVLRAPHVLFLDIGLPDQTGHQVLESIFKIDPDAYVVMFTGRRDEKNVMKAVNLGAQGYITKPFTKNKLLQYMSRSPHLQKFKRVKRAV